MWLVLLVALVFLQDAVRFVFGWGERVDGGEALVGFTLSGLLFLTYFFLKHQRKIDLEFKTWLVQNREALRRGGVLYRDHYLHLNTEVVRYKAVFSFVLLCNVYSSRPFVKGEESGFGTGLLYSFMALLYGWWSHAGIWMTPKVLYQNASGGKVETVESLLQSFLPNLFQHAVILHLRMPHGNFGSEDVRKEVRTLAKQLEKRVKAVKTGKYDGNEWEEKKAILYFYGSNADQLWKTLQPILGKSHFAQDGYAVKRYGPAQVNVRQEQVLLGSPVVFDR